MLTRRGIATAGVAVACWIGAWRLGYPELSIIGTAAFLALAFGSLWLLPSAPLAAKRDVAPPKVARGGAAIGVLRVTNTGSRHSRAARATDRCGGQVDAVDIPSLPPHLSRTFTYPLPTSRRGEIPIGPLRLVLSDPLGLFRRERGHGAETTLLVQPRVLPLAPLPSGRRASLEGPDTEAAPSGTVTFHSLREYVFGDDLRHIHWRTTARLGTLMVRQLVDNSEPRTSIVLDTARDAYADDEGFELAVDIVASVAVVAAHSGFPVTIDAPQAQLVSIRGGTVDAAATLDRLATVESQPQSQNQSQPQSTDLREALRRVTGSGGREVHGSLVVVTGEVGEDVLDQVAVASRWFERTLVIRVDAAPGDSGIEDKAEDKFAFPIIGVDSADAFVAAWHREVRR